MTITRSNLRQLAGACASLSVALCMSQASVASGGPKGSVSRLRVPLDDIIYLWSATGDESFRYPGGRTSQSFDALLWGALTPRGHAVPVRLLSLAVRRSKKFCMVQLASNGLIGYTASDGEKFRSLLFDPRSNGSLVAVLTRAPVIQTFFGVGPSQSYPMFRMGALRRPGRHVFFMSLSRIWLRLMSRHCSRLSYDGRDRVLTVKTLAPGESSRVRFTFSSWPMPEAPRRLFVIISAVDRTVALRHLTASVHLRLLLPGLFPKLPSFAGGFSPKVVDLNTKRIDRSNFVKRYAAAVSAAGQISARAVAARRRFLNWAVGRKEASVLDGWINKGIAPMRPAAQAVKGGTK